MRAESDSAAPLDVPRWYFVAITRFSSPGVLLLGVLLAAMTASGCATDPEEDACPDDENKVEAGLCGCGVPDGPDSDGDGVPDGCDPDRGACTTAGDCDDGLDCTAESCDDSGFCVRTPGEELCPWPAEPAEDGVNLTDVDNPDDPEQSDLRRNLSGAVWNPHSRELWLARNGGPAMVWALERRDDGWQVAEDGDLRKVWSPGDDLSFGDLEAITFADFEEPNTLFGLDESQSRIRQWDFAGEARDVASWDLDADMPIPTSWLGPEGLTFVPDRFLEAQGFRDADGALATSRYGTGGLFFVGHQDEGLVYVFDLDRGSTDYTFIGTFSTAAPETAGLEFDPSTGLLWVFHGGSDLTLEATRLSWTEIEGEDGPRRVCDSVVIYSGPNIPAGGSTNLEGIALMGIEDCRNGTRSAFVTTDDGGDWSLVEYRGFPCR